MTVDTKQLRDALMKVLDHVEQQHGARLEVRFENYWAIPKANLYDTYDAGKQLTLGSLADDYQAVCKVASGSREPVAFDLVHIAAVIKAIGDDRVA